MDARQSSGSGSCLSRALVVQSARVVRRLSLFAERFHGATNCRTATDAFTRKPVLASVLLSLFACQSHLALSLTEEIQPPDPTPAQLALNQPQSLVSVGGAETVAVRKTSALQDKQRKETWEAQQYQKGLDELYARQSKEWSDLYSRQSKEFAGLYASQDKAFAELYARHQREWEEFWQRKQVASLDKPAGTVQPEPSQGAQTKAGDRASDTQLLSVVRQVREQWRQVSTQAQSTKYPDDNQRRDVFDRLLRANQSLKQAEAAAQREDRVGGDQNVRRAQAVLSAVAQRLKEISDQVARSAPASPSTDLSVLAGTVKEMLSQLAPGSEFVGAAEVTGELLNRAPPVLAHKWNTMFEVANPGIQNPPQIDQVWAQNHRAQMIALYVALSRRQTQLEGGTTKTSAANFPQYQELITRARTLWP